MRSGPARRKVAAVRGERRLVATVPTITRADLCLPVRAACSALLLAGLLVACSSSVDESAETAATTTSTSADEQEETEITEATKVEADTPAAELEEPTTTEAPQDDGGIASEVCGVSIGVLFDEGAPRDRITISNTSEPGVEVAAVSFDLSSSAGRIIFDTVDGGRGIEVFQDFQVEDGAAVLASEPEADDGADSLVLNFASFASGESFTFSIDVDDQLADSELGQIQVTGAEIEGATASVELAGGVEVAGTFESDSSANAESAC